MGGGIFLALWFAAEASAASPDVGFIVRGGFPFRLAGGGAPSRLVAGGAPNRIVG